MRYRINGLGIVLRLKTTDCGAGSPVMTVAIPKPRRNPMRIGPEYDGR
jgi:hypothetical protein